MKNVMKKQWKDAQHAPLFKGLLLVVALSSLSVAAFAQGVEINRGTSYTIASTVAASGASTYQWLENGQVISGATAANYTVPDTKDAGIYRYIRQAKSADCSEWQPSNEFVVTVVGPATAATLAPYMDPRDGKVYQTVKMPDGKVWFAQNLNYTKDLAYNPASNVANGKAYTSTTNGVPAIGSYWCPPTYWSNGGALAPVVSGNEAACETYGALYTWETAMMVDGKYADETKTNTTWDESWVSNNYYESGAPGTNPKANVNNARGGGRGICPPGWHVPTELEWATMLDAINNVNTFKYQTSVNEWVGTNEGQKLKSQALFTATTDPGDGSWLLNSGTEGTNTTGFSAVPAGFRYYAGTQLNDRSRAACFWSANASSQSYAWYRYHHLSYIQSLRNANFRPYGFSVRCVRD
jgi:uncharacterized protein (TIGR02145 family)